MKLLVFLVATTAAVYVELDQFVCKTKNSKKLHPFAELPIELSLPCKYWALRRQQCGNYIINLSPGNIYRYPSYELNTLWIGISIDGTDDYFEGRTTNKLAVKHIRSGGERLFVNKKEGNIDHTQAFSFGIESDGISPYMQDPDGAVFRLTFTPWDPESDKFRHPDFKFECFVPTELNEYPEQMCGGSHKKVIESLSLSANIPKVFSHTITYHDILTNEDIVQTNPLCQNATSLLHECPSRERRLEVMRQCQPILLVERHTKCVTRYNCDPMDVFNSCVAWGCRGTGFHKDQDLECKEIAEKIDNCKEIAQSGTLTQKVKDANCFTGFLPLER